MRPENLKPIHTNVADGHDIRRRAAVAINSVLLSPLAANRTALAAFFADCADKASGAAAGTARRVSGSFKLDDGTPLAMGGKTGTGGPQLLEGLNVGSIDFGVTDRKSVV